MLNTVIDFEVFDDFCNCQPQRFPIDSIEKNNQWESFMTYLKSGSNVTLTNYQNQLSLFLTQLTTGREGTSFNIEAKFNKPPNCKFPVHQEINTVFFLKESNFNDREQYINQNGYFVAFQDNYFKKWNELSFYGKRDEINISQHFKSWDEIEEYTLPFTDVLVYDNYIFAQKDRIAPNFTKLIEVIDKKTPVSYNLLIVTHKVDESWGAWADRKKNTKTTIKINDVFKFVNDQLSVKKLKSKLGIIILDRKHREHDRRIFFNYFRIKSGDSFYNYFDENGKLMTGGESIDFKKYVKPEYHTNSIIALNNIRHKIQPVLKTPVLKKLFSCGNLTNQLLTHPKNKGRIV